MMRCETCGHERTCTKCDHLSLARIKADIAHVAKIVDAKRADVKKDPSRT